MDTNAFATAPSMAPQGQTPEYLRQANNPTMAGAASNMIKALMAGDQQFQARQAMGGGPAGGGDGQWVGTSSVGGAPLAGYSGVTPQMGMPEAGPQGGVPMPRPKPPMANPFMGGASPVSMDPVTQALMSPIPGM